MREKKDFFGRIGAYLDLPAQALPGGFSLTLSGEGALCVQGCVSLCSFTEEQVVILAGKRCLRVEGKELFCAELEAGKLLIIGTVTALFLKKEGEHAT
jgi:hypothetical protein